MVIDLSDVAEFETQYIKKEGVFLLEVKKVITDGVGSDFDEDDEHKEKPKIKIEMEGFELVKGDDGKFKKDESVLYTAPETFSTTKKWLWAFKKLTNAMHEDKETIPPSFDINQLTGRFVIGISKQSKKDDRYFNIIDWKYSQANRDKPLLTKSEPQIDTDAPAIEVDDQSIPF